MSTTNTLSATTRVHVVLTGPRGVRLYFVKANNKRTDKGLLLWPDWSEDQSQSVPVDYTTACIIRRRLAEESRNHVNFALTTDSERFVE
jgi:hypothetical protein